MGGGQRVNGYEGEGRWGEEEGPGGLKGGEAVVGKNKKNIYKKIISSYPNVVYSKNSPIHFLNLFLF